MSIHLELLSQRGGRIEQLQWRYRDCMAHKAKNIFDLVLYTEGLVNSCSRMYRPDCDIGPIASLL